MLHHDKFLINLMQIFWEEQESLVWQNKNFLFSKEI